MATSGTSTYNETRGQIIQQALQDVGIVGIGETPDPTYIATAAPYLDNLLKAMSRRGAPLWRISRLTLNVTIGQASYSLPANIDNIDPPARFTQTGLTAATMVTPMPRKQYMYTSDRTNAGTPVQYYLERALDTAGNEVITMYLYPTPSVAGVFEYAAVAKAQDSGTDANTLELAQGWLRCIVLGLVADLSGMARATENERQARVARFEQEFQTVLNADVETGDVQEVVIDYNGYGWGHF